MKKQIAWGTSKLLKMYIVKTTVNPFSYCIDNFSKEDNVSGMPIKKSEVLQKEQKGSFRIVIFAVSNRSIREISIQLNKLGFCYGRDFIFYSDFFYDDFVRKAEACLGFALHPKMYRFALSWALNSHTMVHTTILGTWLFLEILNHLNATKGSIAEVGAFQGGNVLCALQFMTQLNSKKYFMFDSFEGFPELGENDPKNLHKGFLTIETTFQEIYDMFSQFPEAIIVKGFIPATFNQIPENEKFSLVFYDCDLYQPALDTFHFFWDRIVPGGYLLIHDYEVEEGGFTGVKKATDEFFGPKGVTFLSFPENLMAVIKKE